MNRQQNRTFHALIGELNMDADRKADMVFSASGGRVSSSKELTHREANLLIRSLQKIKDDEVSKMRNKIIHLMCLYSPYTMVTKAGKPNYKVIDSWCMQLPVSKGKSIWKMGKSIMHPLLNQVEIIVNKSLKK